MIARKRLVRGFVFTPAILICVAVAAAGFSILATKMFLRNRVSTRGATLAGFGIAIGMSYQNCEREMQLALTTPCIQEKKKKAKGEDDCLDLEEGDKKPKDMSSGQQDKDKKPEELKNDQNKKPEDLKNDKAKKAKDGNKQKAEDLKNDKAKKAAEEKKQKAENMKKDKAKTAEESKDKKDGKA